MPDLRSRLHNNYLKIQYLLRLHGVQTFDTDCMYYVTSHQIALPSCYTTATWSCTSGTECNASRVADVRIEVFRRVSRGKRSTGAARIVRARLRLWFRMINDFRRASLDVHLCSKVEAHTLRTVQLKVTKLPCDNVFFFSFFPMALRRCQMLCVHSTQLSLR